MFQVIKPALKLEKRPKAKPGEWITEDGRRLKIAEMADTHLANTIAHQERRLVELETKQREKIPGSSRYDESDFDDYEFRQRNKMSSFQNIKAKLSQLRSEQKRRKDALRKDELLAQRIRIDLEGPGLFDRAI